MANNFHLRLLSVCLFYLLFTSSAIAQENWKENMTLDGYMKYMNTVIVPAYDSLDITTDNFLHNRLNYAWYVNDNWSFKTSMRNRFFWGELTRQLSPIYADLGEDTGFLDLSILWYQGNSTALHTVFDRMNLTYQKESLEVIVGRQRINWGMSMIWNPNDIFNSYSFFDFDYEERPGTDAVQINYYTGYTSNLSLVYAPSDSIEGSSFAAKYQMNTNGYDLQLMAGYQRQFFVAGGAWSGDIKGAGFKGEGTYFMPQSNTGGETQFVGTVEIDYTFSNGLFVQSSYLFNSGGLNEESGDYAAFYLDRGLTVQTLSPAMHNLFFQASGQLSPIWTAALASMLNPKDGSWFIGPTITWSVVENFDFMMTAQLFRGDPMTLYGEGGSLVFGRFKYSF